MSQTITRQRSFHSSPGNYVSNVNPRNSSLPLSASPVKMMNKSQHSLVSSTNELLSVNKLAKKSARWCVVNIVLALLCYFGLVRHVVTWFSDIEIPGLFYFEIALTVLFSWNVLTNLYLYCLPVLKKQNVMLNPKQKQLLAISKEDERLFKIRDPMSTNVKPSVGPTSSSPALLSNKIPSSSSTPSLSYPIRRTSSRSLSTSLMEYSPSRQPSSTSSLGARSSPTKQSQQYSPGRNTPTYTPVGQRHTTPSQYTPPYSSGTPLNSSRGMSFTSTPSPSVFLNNSSQGQNLSFSSVSPRRGMSVNSQDEQLLDYESLDRFIKQEEHIDARLKRGQESPQKQSFWKYGRAAYEYIPSFATYQLATLSQTPNVKDDDDATESPFKQDEIWRKLGFNRYDVSSWTENIRKWLAQTVLEPLVDKIDNINKRLTQMGKPELHIGTAAISSLQTLMSTKGHHFPSLTNVIAYLNASTNQEYLVARFKELATGGCLRLYCNEAGGKFKGKPWNPDLPTDSQIIIHLFCTYMDTHLPSNPRYAEGKSFTGLHFLKSPSKPEDKKSGLCIFQSRTQKPHFKVLVEDTMCELPKGRNNLFYAIVIFLYYAKQNYRGMIERVNLGSSGINVLWVLNKD